MSKLSDLRAQVRLRANYACEFCGVTETDAGGQLTIDHYQPKSKGGNDELSNLLYCCVCCNQYKHAYWPSQPESPKIWNPLVDSTAIHFLEVEEDKLFPLTKIGSFTIERLRLNRPSLVAHRKDKRR